LVTGLSLDELTLVYPCFFLAMDARVRGKAGGVSAEVEETERSAAARFRVVTIDDQRFTFIQIAE
jgi:hypothetical protein